ncbi:flavin reductase [Pantoea wallisii]|uniref:flavin reductase n=1 Tax=Pantoea wallisii TaxID=1076551 RepID=UPI002697381F
MSVLELPALAGVQQQDFRNAMASLGAAVNIITTDGPAGRAGFTATAVCSVTDAPPTLLVCLNRNASVWPLFRTNGVLCVNTLAAGQEALSTLFGGKTAMDERFAAGDWHARPGGGARGWRGLWWHSTAPLHRLSARARMTCCYVKSLRWRAARHSTVWRGLTAAITRCCGRMPVNAATAARFPLLWRR